MTTRRQLLAGALPLILRPALRAQQPKRPKIACIATVFFKYSHTRHFVDPFPTPDDMKRLVKNPVAYHYEHLDGLQCLVHGIEEMIETG